MSECYMPVDSMLLASRRRASIMDEQPPKPFYAKWWPRFPQKEYERRLVLARAAKAQKGVDATEDRQISAVIARIADLPRAPIAAPVLADHWMAEWLRGMAHMDRGRADRAGRVLDAIHGATDPTPMRGGFLIPQPLVDVIRIKRELKGKLA